MPKRIYVGIICLALTIQIFGQLSKHLAPVNPDIEAYVKAKKGGLKSGSSDSRITGYRPPYAQLPEYYSETPTLNAKTKSALVPVLPAKFDLRKIPVSSTKTKSFVSKVKNQGSGQNGGNCWAFSSLGSMESAWMWKGFAEPDFSEQNVSACHGYGWKYGEGGNEFFPMSYLSRLKGPIKESDDPYNTSKTQCSGDYEPMAYSPDSRWIYNNPVNTKKAIMDYGAVSTNIHWESIYYNASDYSFSSDSRQGPNHAIQLVGWDDDKVTKFGTGAWIAKNSWDTIWAEKGFFYISYNDNHILKPASFYPERWEKRYIDTLFNYDEIGAVTFMGFDNDTAYSLSKFHTYKPRAIREIGTFVARTGSTVKIQIYGNFKDSLLSDLLGEYTSDPVQCPGFYTFNISARVSNDFYVKIRYVNPGFKYPVPIESFAVANGDTFANPVIENSGKQWLSKNGISWIPLGKDIKDWEADLVVHVYTTDNKTALANIATNKYEVCHGSNIEFQAIDDIDTNQYKWNFGQYANPSTATGKGPYNIQISDSAYAGIYYARLIISNNSQSDTLIKEYKIVKSLNVQIAAPDYTKVNELATLTAVCDADQFFWSPAYDLNRTDSKEVIFSSNNPGLHKITLTAVQGSCSSVWSANIEVKSPPSNDRPCNAIILSSGKNGPFTNEGATADFKEPAPADTSCYDDKTWCDEGGVQNSVWFKVVGSANGRLTIDTKGMDTQIAIYESTDCDHIKIGDLIAASDDYYLTAPYAAAIDTMKVTPGKAYFLQVDGSAGGVSGTFYITISDLPIDQIQKDTVKSAVKSNLAVYPNPNNGRMTITYDSDETESVKINITDLTGRSVYKQDFMKEQGERQIPVNISDLKKGIYFISLKGNANAAYIKCILK